MDEVHDRQKEQERMQRSPEFIDAFSKIVSGRPNYKAVVDVKPISMKCRKCNADVTDRQKFCQECGEKIIVKPTHCPKCSKPVLQNDKFCQECGANLEA